jgi:hypothetical protein
MPPQCGMQCVTECSLSAFILLQQLGMATLHDSMYAEGVTVTRVRTARHGTARHSSACPPVVTVLPQGH